MTIWLRDIWPIASPDSYKLHFARWNKINQPLEVIVRNQKKWLGWQEYKPGKNDFNRPFIFALAPFYHDSGTWLFGGVFRVLQRHHDRYEVEMADEGAGLVGRLKLRYDYRDRATRVKFENHYSDLEVCEVLSERYSGLPFPGFEDIDLSFDELETLVQKGRLDWRAALSSVKGVYLISDVFAGKRYIGSAYGEFGIWSRWLSYIENGHGGNVEFRVLVDAATLDYCRKNFRFAILETRSMPTPDQIILTREAFWKRTLLSQGEFGYNRN